MKGAKKGIFITTAGYTDEAKKAASSLLEVKVALIDGKTLATLMIKYNIGVTESAKYTIKKVDQDYFELS